MDWVLLLLFAAFIVGAASAWFQKSMVGAAVALLALAFFVARV